MNVKQIEAYKCGKCGFIYVNKDSAEKCCVPMICDCGKEAKRGRTLCEDCLEEKELQELKEQVVNQEQAKNKTPIGWVPEKGENNYFVYYDRDIKFQINNTEWDKTIVKYTKVFKTEEEAEFYVEKLKVRHELEKFAKEFVYDEENWAISWDYIEGEIYYTFSRYLKRDSIYFKSKKTAQEAVQAVGEDRVKKYYLGVE